MKINKVFIVISIISTIIFCDNGIEYPSEIKISKKNLKEKIKGGWAGKMIGVSYGGPTEFVYRSEIIKEQIEWDPGIVKNSIYEDDLYVQMSFMMTMDKYGIDAPAEKFAESFANAGYLLFHANRKARKNYLDGIMPPKSGNPKYNLHADDIDFQIEADYIGFMSPGMPQTSNRICDKIGHIMNYGDGVYGGMFVSALYTIAYFENDIPKIVNKALQAIPEKSEYARCIQDVIDGYKRNPEDWQATWHEIQQKWGNVDICGAKDPFNIDAKINGAYIVIGLLYGKGDFAKTIEISTRCGQDSDCNPSNAAGVIGIIIGYDNIPIQWRKNIPDIADSTFSYTNYSFNKAVNRTLHYAEKLVVQNGGKIKDDTFYIKLQEPVPAEFEQSFPNTKAAYRITIKEKEDWEWRGDWKKTKHKQWGSNELLKVAENQGSEMTFNFEGTGAVIMGRYGLDCGKVDVYLDGKFMREINNYYPVSGPNGEGLGFRWLNGAHLFHVLNLEPGSHNIKMIINGNKDSKSSGTKLKVSRAIVYEKK